MCRQTRGVATPLAILEDDAWVTMPFWKSPFRVREYETLLRVFPGACVYSTRLSERTDAIVESYEAFVHSRPEFAGRIHPLSKSSPPSASLAYVVFLNNAYALADLLEDARIPFCFELYPGGGFALHQRLSDLMLRRVTSHPYFRAVIATQPVSRDYLVDRKFCQPRQVRYVYGGPFLDPEPTPPRTRFGFGKSDADVCFVAHRYSETGADKGYDLFVDAAAQVATVMPNVSFHVVGDFTSETITLPPQLVGRVTYYGQRPSDFFPAFYAEMDLIVSPNRAFTLAPGAFDGFPTGCCMEAAVRGTAVVCTDPLGLNREFRDGSDLLLIQPNVQAVTAAMLGLLSDPDRLRRIGESGEAAFRSVFDPTVQLAPRCRMLARELSPNLTNVVGRAVMRVFRSGSDTRLLSREALATGLKMVAPTDEVRIAHGNDLIMVNADASFALVCPAPSLAAHTESLLDLRPPDKGGYRWAEFDLAPMGGFPGVDPHPMELTVEGTDDPTGPAVHRIVVPLSPNFPERTVSIGDGRGPPFRYLRFRLQLVAGAASNINAVVKIGLIAAGVRRAA